MRQGVSGRRPRGRSGGGSGSGGGNTNSGGGRKNVPLKTQNFDSNGPDVRVRGNATQVYEKYLSLARDANVSGDRVIAESYFQHAEHYYRILNENTDPQVGSSGNSSARGDQQRRDDQQRGGQRRDDQRRDDAGYGQQSVEAGNAQDAGNGRSRESERDDRGNRRNASPQDDGEGSGEGQPDQEASRFDADQRGTRQERRERYEQSERGDHDGDGAARSHNGEAEGMDGGMEQPRESHQRPDGYGRLAESSSERDVNTDQPADPDDQLPPRKAPRRAATTRTRGNDAHTGEGEAPKAAARRRKPAAAKKPKDGGDGSDGSSDTSDGGASGV